MDLARPNALDNRRVEIVADGLPLFMGAQHRLCPEGQRQRSTARQAWHHRWAVMLAFLERPGGLGSDGATPTTSEVIGEARYTC